MNKKITLQDIIESLIEKHSMERKDAEAFVRGMFDLIEETLSSEKLVKIKGLGTFKLIDVDSRESINVNTGERFKIEGHSKISFTPDATLKNIINKPFSHFETVVLNDGTQLEDTDTIIENASADNLDESSEDIQDEVIASENIETVEETPIESIAAEQGKEDAVVEESVPQTEEIATLEETEEIKEPEETIEAEEVVPEVEETSTNDEVETPAEVDDAPVEEKEVANDNIAAVDGASEEIIDNSEKEETTINDKYSAAQAIATEAVKSTDETKKNKATNIILYVVIVLIIGFACLLFYLFSNNNSDENAVAPVAVQDTTEVLKDTIPVAASVNQDSMNSEVAVNDNETVSKKVGEKAKAIPEKKEEVKKEETKRAEPKKTEAKEVKEVYTPANAYDETLKYRISGVKATHTIQDGEGLMRISKKYYGTKKLYTYILDYNKNALGENGDKIRMGMKIKIPELKPIK